ncbi:methyltransferase domain-containing protein [Streptomyces sp. NPDC059629]|uniref:methyltransferase domain-containing protein n=1 Tax=Streptomyces sp. NPDC059629 TaxID=3346889 RepID=UPI00369BD950
MTQPTNDTPPAYDARSIVVMSGLEAVRRHPAMYVGSTGADGLHQLVMELLDNAVDEAAACRGDQVRVVLHADGSCSVTDDGRGIPVETHPQTRRPACEVVLTTLHSGGKFHGESYTASAGLHGVGLPCVNALSSWLWVEIRRDGGVFRQHFSGGQRTCDVIRVCDLDGPTGTTVRFLPDAAIFETVTFSAEFVADRMEELAFLHPGLRLTLVDERVGAKSVFVQSGGAAGLLARRTGSLPKVHPRPLTVSGDAPGLRFDIAFQWTETYSESLWSFVNGVRTRDGGSHVDGFRAALADAVAARFRAADGTGTGTGEGLDREAGRITFSDVVEGLGAVVIVRTERPRFTGQTKHAFHDPSAGHAIESAVREELEKRFEADEELYRRIVGRISSSKLARLAARRAGRAARFERREHRVDYEAYRRQFGIRSENWHDSCSWLTDEGLLSRHAALADVPSDARLLDVCCGSGVVGAAFRGLVGESVGLDITPEMVRLAGHRLDRVHQGTVYDLPFRDGEFDIVVNREVLHLLPRPELPLAEIHRVLKPGGQFVVGQIMPYGEQDAFWMFRVFKKKQPLLHQMFLESEFRELITGAGFQDVVMEEYFLWESIDRWIDTHETPPSRRREIADLFHSAPAEVRAVHPFEILADGSIRDRWRWCVYSARKPG